MGPRDSRKTVAGAVMPRFTTASATRSSSARSSIVNTSAPDFVEKAWESSERILSHFPERGAMEKEVITVWKGCQNLLSSGIIWRGLGGVNEWQLAARDRRDPMFGVRNSGNLEPRTSNRRPSRISRTSRTARVTVMDARSEDQSGHYPQSLRPRFTFLT